MPGLDEAANLGRGEVVGRFLPVGDVGIRKIIGVIKEKGVDFDFVFERGKGLHEDGKDVLVFDFLL